MDRFGGTPLDDAKRHGNRTAASALEERGALGKGDPKQTAMLEEQMRVLQEQLKETRAPRVEKSVEQVPEWLGCVMRMCMSCLSISVSMCCASVHVAMCECAVCLWNVWWS
eukprot:2316081-Rhodomonas_salina.1